MAHMQASKHNFSLANRSSRGHATNIEEKSKQGTKRQTLKQTNIEEREKQRNKEQRQTDLQVEFGAELGDFARVLLHRKA